MKVQFYLGHPAHFHLFKFVIKNLIAKSHHVAILIKNKDVLEDLVKSEGFDYLNILPEGRKNSKIGILLGVIKRDIRAARFTRKFKPDLLVGTSVEHAHLSKFMGIPFINVNEDDASVVPYYAKFSYPWSTVILSPSTCNNGKWEYKSKKYKGNHELAYLHPKYFFPDIKKIENYFNPHTPYFILRFAGLDAHHDSGISGIDNSLALELIKYLETHGSVYITSERHLNESFEPYRLKILPEHMHHVLSFAQLYIGDSQTMAAEAGVLGTTFIRYNDFVGKIGYLNELENKYNLGFGIKPGNKEKVFECISTILEDKSFAVAHKSNHEKFLKDKIDVADFFTSFIEEFELSRKATI